MTEIQTPADPILDAVKANKITDKEIAIVNNLRQLGYDLHDDFEEKSSAISSSEEKSIPRETDVFNLKNSKNEQNALHLAIRKQHIDVIKGLLQLPNIQENINLGDAYKNTALHFAVGSKKDCSMECIEMLLSHKANVSSKNLRGQTPLAIHLMTLEKDNPTITRVLLKHGVDVNEIVNGQTYLHLALSRNLVTISCQLVAAGASINIPDEKEKTVADSLDHRMFVRLCSHMIEGKQETPPEIPRRKYCQVCKESSLFQSLKQCRRCDREICRGCSKKAQDVKRDPLVLKLEYRSKGISLQELNIGRYCIDCSKLICVKNIKARERKAFSEKIFGQSS